MSLYHNNIFISLNVGAVLIVVTLFILFFFIKVKIGRRKKRKKALVCFIFSNMKLTCVELKC